MRQKNKGIVHARMKYYVALHYPVLITFVFIPSVLIYHVLVPNPSLQMLCQSL